MLRILLFFVAYLAASNSLAASDIENLMDRTSAAYEERSRASHLTCAALSTEDINAMLTFLGRNPGEDVVTIEQLATLKNNAADVLLKQTEPPSKLGETFGRLFSDKEQGTAWRDYIVQKFPALALRLAGPEQGEAVDFLRARIADTEHIYAGTALLGLQRLQEAGLVSTDEIAKGAMRILDGEGYVAASQNTALQVLAKHRPEHARVRARGILISQDPPVMAKVAAIATLGSVGGSQDAVLVGAYKASPDIRLRASAGTALRAIEERHAK